MKFLSKTLATVFASAALLGQANAFSLPPNWKPDNITLPSLDAAKASQCGGHFKDGIPAEALEQTYSRLNIFPETDSWMTDREILSEKERFDISPAILEYIASIPQESFSLCQAHAYVVNQHTPGKTDKGAIAFKPHDKGTPPNFTFVRPYAAPQ